MFSQACVKNSVHRGGLPQCMLGYTPLGRHPRPWADTPWADTPMARHPPWADTPPGKTPPSQTQPPPPSRRLLLRMVRILLECVLVTIILGSHLLFTFIIFLYSNLPNRSAVPNSQGYSVTLTASLTHRAYQYKNSNIVV